MKTILTAAALALAVPAGAVLAESRCIPPTEIMQSWDGVIDLARDVGWTITEMKLDHGCYELRVTDPGGTRLKLVVDPATLIVTRGRVERWSDGTRPSRSS